MADYVSIVNMAASLIGEDDQLRTPDDDTHIGRTARAVWDLCRRAAIRDGVWNFAIRRAGLSAIASPGEIHPWSYAFPLPAESLRLIEVLGCLRAAYQLEGDRILADTLGPLYVRYAVDVTESALWDDLFAEAFARRLAFQIGPRIAGGAYDRQTGWRLYQDALSQAKRVDARENPPQENDWTGWELARFGGGVMPGARF